MTNTPIPKPASLTVMERRQRLQAQGLCVVCGQREATPGPRGGVRYCDDCREKQYQATRRWEKRTGNTPKPRPDYLRPKYDPAKKNEQIAERRRRLQASGICPMCGQRPIAPGPRGGMSTCDECREKKRERDRHLHANRKGLALRPQDV